MQRPTLIAGFMRPRRSYVLIAGLLVSPAAVAQDTCPNGQISRITIQNHSIFDTESVAESGRLRWAYDLANTVHMRTRESFIARSLTFGVGDCYDAAELRETARILRDFRFISRADVVGMALADGSHHVVVDTRDEWTTKVTLNVEVEDGIRFEGGSLFEENLLGRGITVGGFTLNRDERRDLGLALTVPRVGWTDLDAQLEVQRTRGGGAVQQSLIRPFVGESEGYATLQSIHLWRDSFAYVLPSDEPYSHVTIPLKTERFELSLARRTGARGALRLIGGGLSYEEIEIAGVEGVEGIRDGAFSSPEAVPSVVSDRVRGQTDSRRALRLNLLLGVRHLRYEAVEGLDAVGGISDLPVGYAVTATLGRSLGSTGANRPSDLHSSLNLIVGGVRPTSVRQLRFSVEGRREDTGIGDVGGWRDLLFEGQGFLYLFPSRILPQTVVVRGAFLGGTRNSSPFQITLGGPDGLRGYSDTAFPGARRAIASIESRIASPNPFPDFADLAVTVFGDVGSIEAGGVPFGIDSGWRGSVGAGLRLGFPAGSASVIRADIAFPVGPGASSLGPVLRISAREWIGVTGVFRSPQLARSKRSGLTGEYIGVGRTRSQW